MRMPFSGFGSAVLGLGLLALSASATAFDYRDGSAVTEHGGEDIASLYAFVPNLGGAPGPLTVLVSIKPFALSVNETGRTTGVSEYAVRMRPAALVGTGPAVRTRLGTAELSITCRYFDGEHQLGCVASQTGPDGSERVVGYAGGDIGQSLRTKGVRVWSGMRSDPLLANFQAEVSCLDDAEIEFDKLDAFQQRVSPKFRNSIEFNKMNVIELAMEIDRDLLPKEAGLPLLAVAAQSGSVDADGKYTRIDRVGRPHVGSRLIQEDSARNGWNAVDPFDVASATAFREAMQLGMTAVDAQSRQSYWSRPHPLLELMLSDQLLLDPSVAVAPLDDSRNNYFELEWAAYTGQPTKGLPGGRRLVDNVQSRFYAVFARQGTGHFKQLESLKHPLYRPTYEKFPYMSTPYEAHDTLLSRMIVYMSPASDTIRGCEN